MLAISLAGLLWLALAWLVHRNKHAVFTATVFRWY